MDIQFDEDGFTLTILDGSEIDAIIADAQEPWWEGEYERRPEPWWEYPVPRRELRS